METASQIERNDSMLSFLKRNTQDKPEPKKVYAILPAAGSSTRMGTNKLILELDGMPVLRRTLQVFEECDCIDGIILVCREQDQTEYTALCKAWGIRKVVKMVEGGATREHSVLNGVLACEKDVGYVAIHDAARPLVTKEIITEAVETAIRDSAAAPAVAVKDSIQQIKNGRMVQNVVRESIMAVQTPQCFDIDLIRAALTKAIDSGMALTDDCGAVTALGQPVTITTGSYENMKITTPEDILMGEAILKGRKQK